MGTKTARRRKGKRRKQGQGGGGPSSRNHHVPLELAEEILARLPVKDLLRFRAVCSPWKVLIDSSSFMNKHYAQSAQNPTSKTHLIWHAKVGRQPTIKFLCDISAEVSSSLPVDIHQFFEDRIRFFYEFGCVHGLVCLVYKTCYVIWNPSIKQHRVVQLPPENWVVRTVEELKLPEKIFSGHLMAFGFDPKTQDYKFVNAVLTKEQGKALIQVYSLRSNSWKRIVHDFPFATVGPNVGDGYLDGSFYWFAFMCYCKDDGSSESAVVRFDFSDETFELIRLPRGMTACRWDGTVAVTTRGCLELIRGPCYQGVEVEDACEIWGMGEGGLWSKKQTFSISALEVGRPRGICKDGPVIFESRPGKDLFIYNPITSSCTNLGIEESGEFWVFTYVESLFSVKL